MPEPFHQLNSSQFHALVDDFDFVRKITEVHMHHTWQPDHSQYSGLPTIEAMHRYHTVDLGWSDIAQHVSIAPDGMIWTGRSWNRPPASSSGHNGNSASGPFMFETIGNFDTGKDPFGGDQKDAVLNVIAAILNRFDLGADRLRFHRDLNSPKSCPGSAIDFEAFRSEVEAFMGKEEGLKRGLRQAKILKRFNPGDSDDADKFRSAMKTLSAGLRGEPDDLDAEVPCCDDDGPDESSAAPATSAGQRPSKRALCVGIDKYESAPLAGCVNDAREWAATFESLGFDEVVLLLDENATHAAIMEAFSGRISASRPGDVLAFQFACHGTQVDDVNGDEDEDFLDEALVPYDYQTGHFIIDDDLGELFSQIPEGVNVTLFMDCCHSHTNNRAFGVGAPPPLEPGQRVRFLRVDNEVMERHIEFRQKHPTQATREHGGIMREVNFAACRAEQTAKEANGSGYFTATATKLIRENAARTHGELLAALQADFPLPALSQEPKLHCDPSSRDKVLFASEWTPGGAMAAEPTPGATESPGAATPDAATPDAATPGAATPQVLDLSVLAETMHDYIKLLLRLT